MRVSVIPRLLFMIVLLFISKLPESVTNSPISLSLKITEDNFKEFTPVAKIPD